MKYKYMNRKKIIGLGFLLMFLLIPILSVKAVECENVAESEAGNTNSAEYYTALEDCYTSQSAGAAAAASAAAGNSAAGAGGSTGGGSIRNPLGGAGGVSGTTAMINGMIRVVLGFTGLLALISFIYGGILWMISYGDSNKIKKGQDVMKWAVFGLTVIFASYAIVMTLFEFMGIGGTPK